MRATNAANTAVSLPSDIEYPIGYVRDTRPKPRAQVKNSRLLPDSQTD